MATHTDPDWLEDALGGLPPMLTVDEAMAVLRCSRRQVYRLTSTGRVPALRARATGPSRLLIPRAGLRDYLAGLAAR